MVPPLFEKNFGYLTHPAPLDVGGSAALNHKITNLSNATALTGLAFTDNLPAGIEVAAVPNVFNTCGGTVTAVPGSTVITLTGGSVGGTNDPPAGCDVQVFVTATAAGVFTNTAGPVTSNEAPHRPRRPTR